MDLLGGHNQPAFRLEIDGLDITGRIQNRLLSLTLRDNRGTEADELSIELSDHDGQLALPVRNRKAHLWLGWKGSPLIDKGSYTIDEVGHRGTPDRIIVRARSADLGKTLNVKKERSWHDKTLGAIVETIASEAEIEARIGEDLVGEKISHQDQTNESDVNFLTRLASDFGAIATIKQGLLLFFRAGQSRSVSGQELPAIVIVRGSGDSHDFSVTSRDNYAGVTARWRDRKGSKVRTLTFRKAAAEKEDDASDDEVTSGDPDNIKTIRKIFSSEDEARQAAKAEWERLQRGKVSFSISLAIGRPEIFPELPAAILGFKPEIDSEEWIITKVEHTLGDGGFTTDLELEVKADEEMMEED